jgi:brefeldin A-inhibited guanine nucleotide-exchange protein
VATYAVDSLRQLGMKFLDRAELAHFHTHNEFLKPFEYIIRHSKVVSIRDLVIQSMAHMISARAQNIRSGWKSIFVILSRVAAENDDLSLAQRAFGLLVEILDRHWNMIADFLVDYVNCMVDYAFASDKIVQAEQGGPDSIIERAVSLIWETTLRLANDIHSGVLYYSDTEEAFYLRWFPVLSGLTRIIISSPHQSRSTFF